eukprot:5413386-Karenia_brevis.AAC.1
MASEAGLEAYVDWIRRATRISEGQFQKAGLEDWVQLQRRWKFRWAGHTARREDGRWAKAVLSWQPSKGSRGPGHPTRRWGDALDGFFSYQFDVPRGLWA